jgi:hypothetical protein
LYQLSATSSESVTLSLTRHRLIQAIKKSKTPTKTATNIDIEKHQKHNTFVRQHNNKTKTVWLKFLFLGSTNHAASSVFNINSAGNGFLLGLGGQGVGQPVETLVQTVARGGAAALNVPGASAQGVQAELLGDLVDRHGVRQILSRTIRLRL